MVKKRDLPGKNICFTVLQSKLRNARKNFFNDVLFYKSRFKKTKLFKMHQIIKPTCSVRQLFIKITFAFMKIFDFLVKIAIFGAFLFQSRDLRHALLPGSSVGFGQ